MADKKISELTALTGANTASDDYFIVLDSSGTTTKKISRAELNNAIEQDVLATVNIDGGTIDGVTMATSNITVGSSKTLDVSGGTLTLANDQISGDKINGGTINGVTIAAAAFSGSTTHADNVKAQFGTGNDLQIFHDGSDSYISDGGTGDLKIGGATNVKIQNPIGSEIMGIFAADGAVTLYHDNSVKFATASAGVSITGGITSTGTVSTLSINGSAPTATGADVLTLLRSGSAGNYADLNVVAGNTGRSRINFGDTDDMDVGQVSYDHNDNSMAFSTAAAERMRVLSDGKVGIGLAAPAYALDLVTADSVTAQFKSSGASTSYFRLGASGTSNYPQLAVTGDALTLRTSYADRMTIAADGNVGIAGHASIGNAGTASSSRALTVVGATDGTGSSILVGYNSSLASKFSVRDDGYTAVGGGLGVTGNTTVTGNVTATSSGYPQIHIDSTGSGGHDYYFQSDVGSGSLQLIDGDASAVRMYCTSAGLIGVGTTSPSTALQVVGTVTSTGLDVNSSGSSTVDSSGGPAFQVTQSTAGENAIRVIGSHASFTGNVVQPWTVRDSGSEYDLIECVTNNGSQVPWRVRGDGYTTIKSYSSSLPASLAFVNEVGTSAVISQGPASSNALIFNENGSERMRITSGGNVGIGTTAPAVLLDVQGSTGASFKKTNSAAINKFTGASTSSAENMIGWYDGSNDLCGLITITPSANTTSYGTSSDYRLKEAVSSIPDALKKLNALNPIEFSWKKSPEERSLGFLAHELALVVPDAVVGVKDGVDYQQVDNSKLMPLIVAAIQTLSAKIEELEQ